MTRLLQRLKLNKRFTIIAALLLVFLIASILFTIYRFNNRINAGRDERAAASRVEVQESALRAPSTDGITVYLNSADVRATALLNNVRYLATSGGLIALDESGSLKKRYTTLDGLTDNDLTALAVFQNRLFIGTATGGMMAFDGTSFKGY